MAVDLNRGTTLPAEVSSEIMGAAVFQSAVMQLASQVALPGPGVAIPVLVSDPVADWVSETGKKPVSAGTFATKTLRPYKIAVIQPFSEELVRDMSALYNECVNRLPAALAKKFDATVFGYNPAPGSDFDSLSAAPSVTVDNTNTYADLIAAHTSVSKNGGMNTGWAMSPQGSDVLLGAVDGTGRPLFMPNATDQNLVARLLGNPVYVTRGAYSADADGAGAGTAPGIGFCGDWSQARWGTVEGVKIAISDQATVGSINLWEQNMVAVRAEIEIGFRVADVSRYVRILGA